MKFFESNTFHVIGITLLAILLTRFVIYDFSSLSAFTPLEKSTDFEMSDLYNAVEDNKAVHRLSKDVCIVAVDSCDREGVMDVINMLSLCEPAAIGLDLVFPWAEDDNSYLLSTLANTPNLVCANKIKESVADNTRFEVVPSSFYETMIQPQYGHTKLVASSPRSVVRKFYTVVFTPAGDSLPSLPVMLAKQADKERYQELLMRGGQLETIDFTTWEVPVYSASELMNGSLDAEILAGKVVLVGDIQNVHDTYLTPLHGTMSGVMLHALALQTILDATYINTTPEWLNWTIGVLLCILLAFLLMEARNRMSNIGNMFLRLAQVAIMYQLVVLGCSYYASHHVYIDFSPSLLMIGLGALSFDIWFGLYGVFNFVKNSISKIGKK